MKVSKVMTVDFVTVDKDQMLSKALNLMRKKKVTRLIVLEDDKPVGLISFRDVANRLGTYKTQGISPKTLRVSSAMSYPLISISSSEDLQNAAKIMVEKGVSSLVVIDDEELKGLLTKFDLLKAYRKCKTVKVKDLMTPNPYTITSGERIISARSIMIENKFSVLPVIGDDGELIGIVDDQTIADALAKFRESIPIKHQKSRLHEFFVGQVMKTNPPSISAKALLCDLIKVLDETRLKGIPVKDDDEKVVGIVTVSDITRVISEGINS